MGGRGAGGVGQWEEEVASLMREPSRGHPGTPEHLYSVRGVLYTGCVLCFAVSMSGDDRHREWWDQVCRKSTPAVTCQLSVWLWTPKLLVAHGRTGHGLNVCMVS